MASHIYDSRRQLETMCKIQSSLLSPPLGSHSSPGWMAPAIDLERTVIDENEKGFPVCGKGLRNWYRKEECYFSHHKGRINPFPALRCRGERDCEAVSEKDLRGSTVPALPEGEGWSTLCSRRHPGHSLVSSQYFCFISSQFPDSRHRLYGFLRSLAQDETNVLQHRCRCLQHLDSETLQAWIHFLGHTHNSVNGVFHPWERTGTVRALFLAFGRHSVKDDLTLDHTSRMLKRLVFSLTALIWNKIFQNELFGDILYVSMSILYKELWTSTSGHILPPGITLLAMRRLRDMHGFSAHRLVSALICSLSFPVESILPEPGEPTTHVCQLQQLVHFHKDTTTFAAFVRDKRHPKQDVYKVRTVT